VKPLKQARIAEIINEKLSSPSDHLPIAKERVAVILDRDADHTIRHWVGDAERIEELKALPMNFSERAGHLPELMADLVRRLNLLPNDKAPISSAAFAHGVLRHIQGNTAAIMVDE